MSAFWSRVEGLSSGKRKALELLLSRSAVPQKQRTIPRRNPALPCPLSIAQERIRLCHELDATGSAYNANHAVKLTGALDINALAWSLREIVRRHEILRTSFHTADGRPVQAVAARVDTKLPSIDLSSLPSGVRAELVRELIRQQGTHKFDLTRPPLLQAVLLREAGDVHIFCMTTHHIVDDGWSYAVFANELTEHYAARTVGAMARLPELATQFADFAFWDRERVGRDELNEQHLYWMRKLRGATALELPIDRRRPAKPSFRGARAAFQIPAAVAAGLDDLCARVQCTPFVALLTVYKLLLLRYTGQSDIVVGTPLANRNHPDLRPLIGLFVNTAALRTDLSGNPTFLEAARRVRDTVGEALANQEYPFDRIVADLESGRDLSRNPLFQTMFVLQPSDQTALNLRGVRGTPMTLESATTQFDLTMAIRDSGDALGGWIDYSTDLFDASTVARMTRHFPALLASAVKDADMPVDSLSMLDTEECDTLLRVWPKAAANPVSHRNIAEAFESIARFYPESVAVSFEGQDLTYGELNRRANVLAGQLRGIGAGPEERIAICLDPCAETIVAIVGVLKSGAGYVPLDPGWPAERIAAIIEDARPLGVVSVKELAGRVPSDTIPKIWLDEPGAEQCSPDGGDGEGPATGPNLAYIIYTSGSTGKPKGVAVTQDNVLRLFAATAREFRLGASDVWTLAHSYTFDFSVWEIWGALLHGGRLAIVPFWARRSPRTICELLRDEGVTVLSQTPSAFRRLESLETIARTPADLRLRLVVFGGEALDPQILRPWFDRFGQNIRFANMYGITETTVHVTLSDVTPQHVAQGRSAIGRPISGWQAYVLDKDLGALPIGVIGEIYVGGAGLSRGYLRRPEFTATRFIPHPYSDAPGARLYKTGDLGRWRPDGTLEYLGRNDRQVKIRGFRIEPAEIEAALLGHPVVSGAVVRAHTVATGDQQLVAWVVLRDPGVSGATLRSFLSEKLPDYTIPATFVPIVAVPLTANGKLDVAALPSPGPVECSVDEPETVAEIEVARIWCDILGVRSAGRHQTFFELGGHSLLVGRLLARLRELFHVEIELRDLFYRTTISDQARLVEELIMASGSPHAAS
jgi:amino acid adenylation domain-containing protein